jgi:hypothetical protein
VTGSHENTEDEMNTTELLLAHAVAQEHLREERVAAAQRRRHPKRPRPPGRVRLATADVLHGVADRLADRPVPVTRNA